MKTIVKITYGKRNKNGSIPVKLELYRATPLGFELLAEEQHQSAAWGGERLAAASLLRAHKIKRAVIVSCELGAEPYTYQEAE